MPRLAATAAGCLWHHAGCLRHHPGCLRHLAAVPARYWSSRTKAFVDSEMPAVIDLFNAYALPANYGRLPESALDADGLKKVLAAIGEHPTDETLRQIFTEADTDGSGTIELEEFLAASDRILGGSPARCILVVGGPGSGKGVLCDRLVTECGTSHVSCGDMLREEVERGTPLGREVDGLMRRGELVSSETVVALLRRRMRAFPGRRLLLDGFPRSRQNAEDFAALCGKPELALHLTCPDSVMVERILKRADEQGRADDNYETALARIRTYHESGEPTLEWLRQQHVPIVEVDCSGTPGDAWEQLLAVGRLMRPAVAL